MGLFYLRLYELSEKFDKDDPTLQDYNDDLYHISD